MAEPMTSASSDTRDSPPNEDGRWRLTNLDWNTYVPVVVGNTP
jgi:hypothetical protein